MATVDKTVKVTEEYDSNEHLTKTTKEHQPRKTGWDLLQLLIIPLLIAGLGIWFTGTQNQTSLQIAKDNRAQDLQIAKDTQESATLKTTLDDMKDLMLNHRLMEPLKPKGSSDNFAIQEVRTVAQAEIIAVVRQLDGTRKGLLIRFLSRAGLLTDIGDNQIISLEGAELSYADLRGAILDNANLNHADLSHADLRGIFLRGANLSYADLSHADLQYASLNNAILTGAILPDGSKHP